MYTQKGTYNIHKNTVGCMYMAMSTYVVYHLLAIFVMFSENIYSVNENSGSVQFVLVLNNPSSTDITVQVTNIDLSATGEYCSILINY